MALVRKISSVVEEIKWDKVHFFVDFFQRVPGVMEKKEVQGKVRGKEVGKEGFLPGCNLKIGLSNFLMKSAPHGFLTFDFLYNT